MRGLRITIRCWIILVRGKDKMEREIECTQEITNLVAELAKMYKFESIQVNYDSISHQADFVGWKSIHDEAKEFATCGVLEEKQ